MKYLSLSLAFLLIACASENTHTSNQPPPPPPLEENQDPQPSQNNKPFIPFPLLIDRETFNELIAQPRNDNNIKPFTPHEPINPPQTPHIILRILENPPSSP